MGFPTIEFGAKPGGMLCANKKGMMRFMKYSVRSFGVGLLIYTSKYVRWVPEWFLSVFF